MKVQLVAYTSIVEHVPGYTPHDDWTWSADQLAEEMGRLDYESWDRPNPKTATNRGYVANILEKGHLNVLEHASATLYVEASRNWSHQMIRHRHFSFSEVSQRYVNASKFDVEWHPGLAEVATPDEIEVFKLTGMWGATATYNNIVSRMIEKGYSRKQAREAARSILPGMLQTKIAVTGNMRAWREMLQKRLSLDPNGQPLADREFYEIAKEMLKILKGIAPNCFQGME